MKEIRKGKICEVNLKKSETPINKLTINKLIIN